MTKAMESGPQNPVNFSLSSKCNCTFPPQMCCHKGDKARRVITGSYCYRNTQPVCFLTYSLLSSWDLKLWRKSVPIVLTLYHQCWHTGAQQIFSGHLFHGDTNGRSVPNCVSKAALGIKATLFHLTKTFNIFLCVKQLRFWLLTCLQAFFSLDKAMRVT